MLVKKLLQQIPEDTELRFARQADRIASWAVHQLLPTFHGIPGLAHQQPEGDARLNEYLELTRIEQSFQNLLFVQLYHLWEQQLAVLVRDFDRRIGLEYHQAKVLFQRVFDRFGFDITFLDAWPEVHVLRLTANVVKHSAAKDAEDLRSLRSHWFRPPEDDFIRFNFEDQWPQPELAAAGQDIFPQEHDYHDAVRAVRAFWVEFGDIRLGRKPKPKTLRQWVVEKRTDILSVCTRHGASDVRVFGSVARNEAGPASDIDLLVEIPSEHEQEGWLPTTEILKRELERLLDHRVDVVATSTPNKNLLQRALRDAVPL